MGLKRALLKAASGSAHNCSVRYGFCSRHFPELLPVSILKSSLDYNGETVRQFAILRVAWGVKNGV
jgi:hypothetical protein